MTAPPELDETDRETCWSRAADIAAFDGDTPVGIATAYSFDLTVPGGTRAGRRGQLGRRAADPPAARRAAVR